MIEGLVIVFAVVWIVAVFAAGVYAIIKNRGNVDGR